MTSESESIDNTSTQAESQKTHKAQTIAALERLGLPQEVLPKHVAIIMDGNGRWAEARGMERYRGHEEGAKTVREIVTECARLELDALTLYSFSSENWKRPKEEIDFLMQLYVTYLVAELPTMMANNVRFVQIGRREGLSDEVLAKLDETRQLTEKNTGLTLALAINYGSRDEIVDGIKAIASKVKAGEVSLDQIDESMMDQSLYTAGLPDPDLLIRTAGEQRLSNYLLWQLSYAELFFTETCWPEFGVTGLREAIRIYAKRQRRFGSVLDEEHVSAPSPANS